MKDYKTITRAKVDADPAAPKYFTRETHLMQDWSDKMIDLVLNGPTLNAFPKDEVRAMLRETYEALKRYEMIGPMASPFLNDPPAIVAKAFRELYPKAEYAAQLVPDLRDENGTAVYGETLFPDDGSTPVICISAEAPISAAPELLAHELAHVVAGEEAGHGPAWEAAETAIFQKYNEILDAMIPDAAQEGDTGGVVAMISRANIPEPHGDDWKLTTCPDCGAECWETDLARQALAADPTLRAACTLCALKAGTTTAAGKEDTTGRCCENCGNVRCASSLIAFNWDDCVASGFTRHWTPKLEKGDRHE